MRIFLLGLILFFAPITVLAGFGISPPQINEQNAVPGASFERTIYLVQGNPEHPITVEITVDGDRVKDWFSFPNGTQITIPEGVQQYPLVVTSTIPEDTDLGIYRGFIRINTVPKKAEDAGEVAISIGARIDVSITVGDDVIESYEIGDIKILNVGSREPLAARFKVRNVGNVAAGPTGASFELFDKFNTVRLAFAQATISEQAVAFRESDISVEFPVDLVLAPGEYWGHVKIFDADNTLLKESKTVFEVKEGLALANVFSVQTLSMIGIILAALIVSFGLLATFRSRRKKR